MSIDHILKAQKNYAKGIFNTRFDENFTRALSVSDRAFYTAVFTVPQFHSCVMDVLSEILNQNRIFTNNETEYFKYFSRIHSVDKQHICANQDYNIVVFCANRTIQFLCALAGREEDKCLYFKC